VLIGVKANEMITHGIYHLPVKNANKTTYRLALDDILPYLWPRVKYFVSSVAITQARRAVMIRKLGPAYEKGARR
jgi:hypothetical protein